MAVSKKIKNYSIGFIILIVILLLLLPKILEVSNTEKLPLRKGDGRAISVKAAIIKKESVQETIFSNGTLLSNEEAELRSEISGRITEIYFSEGKNAFKGDLLVKINDSEIQASLKKNRAKEKLASDREFRLRQMLEKGLTSQYEYDIALEELNSIKADIEYNEAMLAKTEIRAPFSGIIGLRYVSPGSYIAPEKIIATIQSLNPLKAEFSVPQKYSGMIKPGKEIIVKTGGKSYNAKIYAVEPKIDLTTRTVKVRALVPNANYELKSGSYTEIEVITDTRTEAVVVPSNTIIPDIDGEMVFVYRNGKAEEKRVKSGLRTDEGIEIISGLNFGDTLIVSGIIQLKGGAPVKLSSIN